jgi:hypothetical protein
MKMAFLLYSEIKAEKSIHYPRNKIKKITYSRKIIPVQNSNYFPTWGLNLMVTQSGRSFHQE